MNERLEKVLDYEKKLIQDREQLIKLIAESDSEDTHLIKNKLDYFAQELAYMNRQVEMLKIDMLHKGSELNQGVVPAKEVVTRPQMQVQPQIQVQPQVQAQPPKPGKQTKDLEKTVGKSLMGIFASVLIFISLILFATLLLPYFNDTAKMITTYIVSFAFTGVGLYKLKKDKSNKFYVALAGCGVGAIYISILLSNIYFNAIGDIVLYVLIALWGIGVCFLAKIQNRIFEFIGHLGIMISVIFGCVLCILNSDIMKFMVLIVFYFVSSTIFYLVHRKKDFADNAVFNIFNVINYIVLSLSSIFILHDGLGVETMVLPIILMINIGIAFINSTEKNASLFGVALTFYILPLFFLLAFALKELNQVQGVVFFVIAICLILLLEWKKMDERAGKYIPQIVLIWLAAVGLGKVEVLLGYDTVLLLILPLLLWGFYKKNEVCKYGSLILYFIYTFVCVGENIWYTLIGCVIMAVAFYLIYRNKEQYSIVCKYFVHILTLLTLLFGTGDTWHLVLTYVVLVIFNIALMKSCFGRNLKTGEKEAMIIYNIVNIILMISGLILVGSKQEGLWHILAIITTVAVFMANAKNILDKRKNVWGGIYVGAKLVILMNVILSSFDAVNFVISIACLIFAIVCIVIGFKFDYKSLRIFGLILSMISIFKLIMVDITYQNTLGNALSFFVSGILCFAISMIYNYIDKKVLNTHENME